MDQPSGLRLVNGSTSDPLADLSERLNLAISEVNKAREAYEAAIYHVSDCSQRLLRASQNLTRVRRELDALLANAEHRLHIPTIQP